LKQQLQKQNPWVGDTLQQAGRRIAGANFIVRKRAAMVVGFLFHQHREIQPNTLSKY